MSAKPRPRSSGAASSAPWSGVAFAACSWSSPTRTPGSRRRSRRCSAAPGKRCSVHFLREALGHARREQQPMLAALIRPFFNADSGEQSRELVSDALERLRKPLPKIAMLLEAAEDDLL